MNEVFKDIKGYEGLYQISNKGRVKRFYKNGNEHLLKPFKNSKGYLQVNLWENGKCENYKIHRLVAEAFISNPNNLPTVNHIKEFEKTNNCVENLEWMSYKDQNNYGTHNKRSAKARTNGKLSKPIIGINKVTGEQIEFPSLMEASRQLGINQGNINHCCNGKRKSAGGYTWKYKERC